LRHIEKTLFYLGVFLTLTILVLVYLDLIDRAAEEYVFIVGGSAALWGVIIAFFSFRRSEEGVQVWKILLSAALGYLMLLLFYWAFVPDIVITGWGPIPDKIGSWLIAGMTSVCSLIATGLVLTAVYFLAKYRVGG